MFVQIQEVKKVFAIRGKDGQDLGTKEVLVMGPWQTVQAELDISASLNGTARSGVDSVSMQLVTRIGPAGRNCKHIPRAFLEQIKREHSEGQIVWDLAHKYGFSKNLTLRILRGQMPVLEDQKPVTAELSQATLKQMQLHYQDRTGRGRKSYKAPRQLVDAVKAANKTGMPFKQIGEKFAISPNSVKKIVAGEMPVFDFDGVTASLQNEEVVSLPTTPPEHEPKTAYTSSFKAWVKKCYVSGCWTNIQIAEKFGLAPQQVAHWCSAFGKERKKNQKALKLKLKAATGTVPEPKNYYALPAIPAGEGVVVQA